MVANNNDRPSWIKHHNTFDRKNDDGSIETRERIVICNEQFDANSGAFLCGAQLSWNNGSQRKVLTVKVPHRVLLDRTISAVLYDQEQWAARGEGKTLAPETLTVVNLAYLWTDMFGVGADAIISAEIFEKVISSAAIVLVTKNLDDKHETFEISLEGFRQAHEGPGIRTSQYDAQRTETWKKRRRLNRSPSIDDCLAFIELHHSQLSEEEVP